MSSPPMTRPTSVFRLVQGLQMPALEHRSAVAPPRSTILLPVRCRLVYSTQIPSLDSSFARAPTRDVTANELQRFGSPPLFASSAQPDDEPISSCRSPCVSDVPSLEVTEPNLGVPPGDLTSNCLDLRDVRNRLLPGRLLCVRGCTGSVLVHPGSGENCRPDSETSGRRGCRPSNLQCRTV